MKFRKKPVVITAEQATERQEIVTLEGTMVAEPGDWIITGVKGEGYPCKPDIFAATYEPADTTEPAPELPTWATCVLCGKQTERTEVACLDCQKYAVDLVRVPVATPTPDVQAQIDAAVARERQACADYLVAGHGFTTLAAQMLRARSAKGEP